MTDGHSPPQCKSRQKSRQPSHDARLYANSHDVHRHPIAQLYKQRASSLQKRRIASGYLIHWILCGHDGQRSSSRFPGSKQHIPHVHSRPPLIPAPPRRRLEHPLIHAIKASHSQTPLHSFTHHFNRYRRTTAGPTPLSHCPLCPVPPPAGSPSRRPGISALCPPLATSRTAWSLHGHGNIPPTS